MSKSTDLYARARTLIPGGSQLLSKRPETFLPEGWPAYYRRARGVEVEDLDGRVYTDVTLHAVGSCPLGYADPDVEAAVIAAVRSGSMSTLNCPEEVELAELLIELHPWAEMVRYSRTGGEAMAVAVRIARAATGREKVAFCGYHGWHDWYLAANLKDGTALDGHLLPNLSARGVPEALAGTVLPFADVEEVADAEGLAAIVMEPARYSLPAPGYLARAKEIASKLGAVLIFDEITSGFRMHVGGLHRTLGVDPDVAVFAKAMSNGYPMGAIIGVRSVMDAVDASFISSTYWTERIGPVAALATIRKMARAQVPAHLCRVGRRMREGWEAIDSAVPLITKGVDPLPSFALQHEASRALHTLYTQYMLEAGFLASGAFYASYAHDDAVVDRALAASEAALERIAGVVDSGRISEALNGPVAHTGLRK